MDLLIPLLTCNLFGSDPQLVRAIAANSHNSPLFVMDASADATIDAAPSDPKTVAEAVARVADITAHGGKPVLGLLQVPPAWLAAYGQQLADAFDPCVNIAIGSAMLSAFDDDCVHHRGRPIRPRPLPDAPAPNITPLHPLSPRRLCVVRAYADATEQPDLEQAVTLELNQPAARTALPDPVDAPIFPTLPPRTWGPDRLLVPWIKPVAVPDATTPPSR